MPENEASFICPRCTGAGCVSNNHRVETCEECGGAGRFSGLTDPSGDQASHKMTFIPKGSLFDSHAQTWVNAVNCVGVMGKGLALEFKNRFPEMYRDYAAHCSRREVRLGAPYLFVSRVPHPWILNFPTKYHWRDRSSLEAIAQGLEYLAHHYKAWGITSMAVPALGCGLGQLEWGQVRPLFDRYLKPLQMSIEIYPPRQITQTKQSLDLERD